MRRSNLIEVFEGFASAPEDFLYYDDGLRVARYTYLQVSAAAKTFGSRLRAAGLTQGSRVILWAENRPEWIVAYWGCVLIGAVVVPVDYRASWELLQRVQATSEGVLLLTGDETASSVRELPIPVWHLQSIEWAEPAETFQAADVSGEDLAEILFTSGATAEPKGVLIRHSNILANIDPVETEVGKYKKYGKPFYPIRFLNLLPLSHMFGQAMGTFIPPMLRGQVHFLRGYNPQEIIRHIRSQRVSVLVCVPKILEVLRDAVLAAVPEAAEAPKDNTKWYQRWWQYRRVHRLLGWKFWSFIVGAAPLNPELEEFWRKMGYVVIQGYGLTETAPIVTLNHPFHTKKGTVGKPIAGVEVKISDDGEILVRGGNVSTGYLNEESSLSSGDGWFHTGDVGNLDEAGQLYIRGRKKEMIVTPEGLNVFPEDVEAVLLAEAGVLDAAAVGQDRVHAVLVLEGVEAGEVVRRVNAALEDHQKIRGFSIWPEKALPRTEGTRKLKRREIQKWVEAGAGAVADKTTVPADVISMLAGLVPGREVLPRTTLEELGLSSLERVELLMALERRFDVTIDEAAFAAARTAADLQQLVNAGALSLAPVAETVVFPSWNRSKAAQWVRRINLPLWVLPLARIFIWIQSEGVENLEGLNGPVLFAPNHQSHFDMPAILSALPAKWRYRVAPAMSKEFFRAHFFPKEHRVGERITNSLNYYLSSLVFNGFPIPRREAGTRQTLRYAGELASEGWCILIFPEGKITEKGELNAFQAGVGMLGSKLKLPVVPVRLEGLDRVLGKGAKFPTPGRVKVKFGKPLHLEGEDFAKLAKEVEAAVRAL